MVAYRISLPKGAAQLRGPVHPAGGGRRPGGQGPEGPYIISIKLTCIVSFILYYNSILYAIILYIIS